MTKGRRLDLGLLHFCDPSTWHWHLNLHLLIHCQKSNLRVKLWYGKRKKQLCGLLLKWVGVASLRADYTPSTPRLRSCKMRWLGKSFPPSYLDDFLRELPQNQVQRKILKLWNDSRGQTTQSSFNEMSRSCKVHRISESVPSYLDDFFSE